jgi:hypothetical protein
MIATAALARQQSAPVKTVEITSNVTEAEVGQQLKLTVVANRRRKEPERYLPKDAVVFR